MERRHQVFSVDLLERYATKGRGAITCMATGNDVIVLGTSKGWVIRHDFGVGDSYDIDLSVGRPGEQSVHKVFVDPGGSHCIATVIGSSGADTYYTHAKWTKPRILSKLKGLVVNAVAWNRQHITEASTREIIMGTDNGQLYEMAVDVKDKMEKYVKLLFELKELPEAFTGLQMETASVHNGTRFYVMAVTPTRLYSFTGIGSFEAVFTSYVERTVHFMELPGEITNSELHFFIKQRRAVHFAWLSGAGIYHGDLKFGVQHSLPNGDENFVENKALLDYSNFSEGVEVCMSRGSPGNSHLDRDKINRLLLEDDSALDSNNTDYQSLIKEFRAFLSDCKDVLDEATTMKLLESYGRVDELVFFASLKEQYEIVLHRYIQVCSFYVSFEMLIKDVDRGQSSRSQLFIAPTAPTATDKKVEGIIDHQLIRGKGWGNTSAQFLVHWKGQPPEEATWEKYEDLWQFKDQVHQYLKTCGAAVVANFSGGECYDTTTFRPIFPPLKGNSENHRAA